MAAAAAGASRADFDALIARLRRHFVLTPTDCLRLQRTATLMASRGVALDSAEATVWLAPIVCRSAAEQEHFYQRFGRPELVAPAPPEAPESPSPRSPAKVVRSGVGAARRNWRRLLPIVVLAALIVLAFLVFRPPPPDEPANNQANANQAVEPPPAVLPSPSEPQPPPAQPNLRIPGAELLVRIAIAIAVLLLGWLAWRLGQNWERRRLRREPAPETSSAEAEALALSLPGLFARSSFRHALGALRRHQTVASDRLHIVRTIRATIRSGGRPVLRFGLRPRTPEYVLLADRESPRDHLPLIADILTQRMGEEKINVTSYEYFGDPRRLRRTSPDPDPAVRRLADLAPSHPGARLMMVAEGRDCRSRRGEPLPWLAELATFDRAILFDPARAADRLAEVPVGAEENLLTASATPAGVLAYANRLAGQAEARLETGVVREEMDLPARLARRRDFWLDDLSPDETVVAALLDDLEAWLGADGMRLLRMTALFPLVDAALTLLLGRLPDVGLDERMLLRLARLPWLRAGHMPPWLRQPLVRGLSEGDLKSASATILAYLSAEPGKLEAALGEAGDQILLRRRLLAWLEANPGSEYHDPIMIDALRGKPPAALGGLTGGRGRRPGWLRRFTPIQRRIGVAFALFASVTALVALSMYVVRPDYVAEPPLLNTVAQDLQNAAQADTNSVDAGNETLPAANTLEGTGGTSGNTAQAQGQEAGNNMNEAERAAQALEESGIRGVVGHTVAAGPVNLREGPSFESRVVARVQRDAIIYLGELRNGWWSVALPNGARGYMVGDYVGRGPPAAQTPNVAEMTQRAVTSSAYTDLQVRAGPSETAATIATLSTGATFTVGPERNGWRSVLLDNGTTGYVRGTEISILAPGMSPRTPPQPAAQSQRPRLLDMAWNGTSLSVGDRNSLQDVAREYRAGGIDGILVRNVWMHVGRNQDDPEEARQAQRAVDIVVQFLIAQRIPANVVNSGLIPLQPGDFNDAEYPGITVVILRGQQQTTAR